MLARAHPGPVRARHAPRSSLRWLAAVCATPPLSPEVVAPSAGRVLPWMTPGLEPGAGTAPGGAVKDRPPAPAALALGPPGRIQLPFGRLPGVTANPAGHTALDGCMTTAARAQAGVSMCPEALPASLPPVPSTALRIPAAVEPAGRLAPGVPGALGLAPLLAAGAAQAAVGREGLSSALRTHPAGEALFGEPAVAFPAMLPGLVGVPVGHRYVLHEVGIGTMDVRPAPGRQDVPRRTPLIDATCSATQQIRPSTGLRSSGG